MSDNSNEETAVVYGSCSNCGKPNILLTSEYQCTACVIREQLGGEHWGTFRVDESGNFSFSIDDDLRDRDLANIKDYKWDLFMVPVWLHRDEDDE